MKTPFTDEEVLTQYRKDATESPSADLDNRVLQTAKAALENASNVTSLPKKRRWPHRAIGIAAGIILVTLLAPWRWLDDNPSMELQGLPPENQRGLSEETELQQAPLFLKKRSLSDSETPEAALSAPALSVGTQMQSGDVLQMGEVQEQHGTTPFSYGTEEGRVPTLLAVEAGEYFIAQEKLRRLLIKLDNHPESDALEEINALLSTYPELEDAIPEEVRAQLTSQ
ncbi:hypothetical protein [Thaumasiovibrio subtropicus]|uniref:hypothetical protein n=1 Tax=Thaumasiovibrio subtropicus TaxID=1891207 RepID=UPI000B35A7BB|nr:hypothetical protein [Thaumasiovibrio subtropicus]